MNTIDCEKCNGKGTFIIGNPFSNSPAYSHRKCDNCGGLGKIDTSEFNSTNHVCNTICKRCENKGYYIDLNFTCGINMETITNYQIFKCKDCNSKNKTATLEDFIDLFIAAQSLQIQYTKK